jgi:uncharacterized protein
MRWLGNRESDNVEDRRGSGGSGLAIGGGIGGIVIAILYVLLGGNPSDVVNQVIQPVQTQQQTSRSPEEEKLASFTKVILGLTETVWDSIYQAYGDKYNHPKLVLFSDQTQSGCGFASAATGRFIVRPTKKYISIFLFLESYLIVLAHRVNLQWHMLLRMK